MKKKRNMILGILLLLGLLAGICVQAEETQETGAEEIKIGVAVYDPGSSEMNMFINYYRDYLEEGFPVKFYFSDKITSVEAENDFIRAVKEQGAQGIISFLGMDVKETIRVCEENEMYYVLGSGSISDEDYEAVKENPWFLGTIGPEPETVHQAGCDMADYFLKKGGKSFLIMSGGASRGSSMHALRTQGMLEVLEEQAGLVLPEEPETMALVDENTTLTSSDGTVSVTICPDYTEGGDGLANLESAFADGTYDVLMSAFHANTYMDKITEKEGAQGSNIMVGAIDSFTEQNFEIFKERDAFGNAPIDYVQGKYASMAGPAFAMVYNAVTGHPEANTPDGEAVRLYQGFWTADNRERYIELYGYTTGIYENAYSCDSLMQVIKVFHDDASPEKLKELTEAYSVEDVKARILGE